MLAVLALVAGCSEEPSRVPVYKVQGRATYNGQPMARAMIGFHPQGSSGARAFAQTTKDGSFQMTTYDSGDGASAGEHIVTIFWPDPSFVPPPVRRGEKLDEDEKAELESLAPNKLGKQHADPARSPLRATVAEQDNHIDFALP